MSNLTIEDRPRPRWARVAAAVGIDWGAVIVVGIIALLAVARILPRIPW